MRFRSWIGVALWALLRALPAAGCERTAGMPDPVPLLRNEYLGVARYRELADAWSRYLQQHPQSPLAYVHLWRAQSLSQQAGWNDGLRLVQQAYAIDPDCPEVLNELARLQFGPSVRTGSPAPDQVRRWSERAIELAPDWYDPHVNLLVQDLVAGKRDGAREQLRAIVAKRGMSANWLDFGYNLLMCAAPDAIVVTNGDNDTIAALAVQALHGIREDVRIVNASLLNLAPYARGQLSGDGPFTRSEFDALESRAEAGKEPLSQLIWEELGLRLQQSRLQRPLYFSTTVPLDVFSPYVKAPAEQVALAWHMIPGAAWDPGSPSLFNAAASESLLTSEFRMDSALDLAAVAARPAPSDVYAQQIIRKRIGTFKRILPEPGRYPATWVPRTGPVWGRTAGSA